MKSEDEATRAAREYARKQSEESAEADSLSDLKRKYDSLMKDSLRMQEYIKSQQPIAKVETMGKAEKPGQVEVKKARVKCVSCSSEFVVQNKSVSNPICMECGCSEVERVGRPWTEYEDAPEKSSGDLWVMSAAEYAAMQSGQNEKPIKDYQFPGIDKDYQEAETEASVDTELTDALELVLMFFNGRSWDEDKIGRWSQVTGTPQATTRVLCDHIRQVLRNAK